MSDELTKAAAVMAETYVSARERSAAPAEKRAGIGEALLSQLRAAGNNTLLRGLPGAGIDAVVAPRVIGEGAPSAASAPGPVPASAPASGPASGGPPTRWPRAAATARAWGRCSASWAAASAATCWPIA